MTIADAHCDILLRLMRGDSSTDVTPATLRAGRVSLQLCAAFAGGADRTPYKDAVKQLDILDYICGGAWPSLRKAQGVPERPEPGVTYTLSTIEGGEALEGSIERLHEFYARGVRVVTLLWNHENELGHPAAHGGKEGLKPQGRLLVREMRRLGVAIDVSHLNDRGFYDLADMGVRLMASHSNARALHEHPRNLTDEQLKLLAQSGGFVGINFYPAFLSASRAVSVGDITRHTDYIMNLTGEGCVGFGSDFDGIDSKPTGIETPADFPKIAAAFEAKGYSPECIDGICSNNLMRFLCAVCG